jgi:hypothetical protein
MKNVLLHSGAEAELWHSVGFYESIRVGLGLVWKRKSGMHSLQLKNFLKSARKETTVRGLNCPSGSLMPFTISKRWKPSGLLQLRIPVGNHITGVNGLRNNRTTLIHPAYSVAGRTSVIKTSKT